MNQDDQRFVLMAAAAQAHYAKEQARREARKAALLSQVSALSNSSQPMDPKLQAELERGAASPWQVADEGVSRWSGIQKVLPTRSFNCLTNRGPNTKSASQESGQSFSQVCKLGHRG